MPSLAVRFVLKEIGKAFPDLTPDLTPDLKNRTFHGILWFRGGDLKMDLKKIEEKSKRSIENMRIMDALFEFAFEVKKHQIKIKNPTIDEETLNQETLKLIEAGCR